MAHIHFQFVLGDRALCYEVNSCRILAVAKISMNCGSLKRVDKLASDRKLHRINAECLVDKDLQKARNRTDDFVFPL